MTEKMMEGVMEREYTLSKRLNDYRKKRDNDRTWDNDANKVDFTNPEGVRIMRTWGHRKDLMENMFNTLLTHGTIGSVEVPENEYDNYVSGILLAIEDMGLGVIADDEAETVKIVDLQKGNKRPEPGDYLPKELIRAERSWKHAVIVELNISPPEEKSLQQDEEKIPQLKRYLALDVGMKEMLEIKKGVYGPKKECYEKLIEGMLGATKVNNLESIFLIPLSTEDETELAGKVPKAYLDEQGSDIFGENSLSRHNGAAIEDFIKDKVKKASGFVINSHGLAGKDIYSMYYENNGMISRIDPDAIIILPSVMGSKGTMYHIGQCYPEEINQFDQVLEIDLLTSSYGLYNKKLGVIGQSMGGGMAVYFALLKQRQEENYKDDFFKWLHDNEEKGFDYIAHAIQSYKKEINAQIKARQGLMEEYEDVTEFEGEMVVVKKRRVKEGMEDEYNRRGEAIKVLLDRQQFMEERADEVVMLINGLGEMPDIWIISEQPCLSREDAHPITVPKNLFGLAVAVGNMNIVNQLFPGLVGFFGDKLTEGMKATNIIKYGEDHNKKCVRSIKDNNKEAPTNKQVKGIKKSEGLNNKEDWVSLINRCTNFFAILAKNDHILDYKVQVEELNKWGLDILLLHLDDADHFACASPEHGKNAEPWYKVASMLKPKEWEDFMNILRKAVYTDSNGKIRRAVERGINVFENTNKYDMEEMLQKTKIIELIERCFPGPAYAEKVKTMKLAVQHLDQVTFSKKMEEPTNKEIQEYKRFMSEKEGHTVPLSQL